VQAKTHERDVGTERTPTAAVDARSVGSLAAVVLGREATPLGLKPGAGAGLPPVFRACAALVVEGTAGLSSRVCPGRVRLSRGLRAPHHSLSLGLVHIWSTSRRKTAVNSGQSRTPEYGS